MKIWTTLTGAEDVAVHLSREAAVDHLVAFLAGCDDARTVTRDNWQDALAAINAEMDASGESPYAASLAEHTLPSPRLVVEQDADGVHALHTDSPLLDGVEAVTIRADFDGNEYDSQDIMEFAFGGGRAIEFVGAVQAIQRTEEGVRSAYEAVEARDAGSAPRP